MTLVPAEVVRVIDGDTVDVEVDGRRERVRLIGIDTPESVHPERPVECFALEASAQAKALMAGQAVGLEEDLSQDSRDHYGRLLRYVWLADGRLVNLELVREGYAFEYTYDLPYRYQADFRAAEAAAREGYRGLWSLDSCAGDTSQGAAGSEGATPVPPLPTAVPMIPTAVPPLPIAPVPSGSGGDPSYPDVCIPPAPPDLDCGDISYRRFTVLSPDPHGQGVRILFERFH